MSTPTYEHGHLLLFRGTDWHKSLSPEDIQRIMTGWNAWFEGLKTEGKLISGSPLENEGRLITSKTGSVADGPFAESKEAIGGFFMLNVKTMEEAVEIARRCPALGYGISVEVRPVAPACPVDRFIDEVNSHADA